MTSGTILCVDDDPTVLSALRALLGRLGTGYAVEIAEAADEALEIEAELRAQGREIAVVISDFIMPGIRGDEFLVRLHDISPKTIKIMLTGQSAFDGVKRAINHANLYRFLEKPFDNDDLLLTVKSACVAYEYERELQRQNDQLKNLNAELEQMLHRLHNQQEELARSEARATIGTLVASVSHELGTPIGNSLIAADMLLENVVQIHKDLLSASLKRDDLEMFVQAVEEGGGLLQKNLRRAADLLLNFKQVAADQASEQRRIFDLAEVVSEIIATLAPSLRGQPHQVELDIASGILMDSHPGALGQVVINLVNNAYVHAFEGRSDGLLKISAVSDGREVVLRFVDNGVGMSSETLENLMQPFFTTKMGKGGTGLGMSIVDNLVSKSLAGKMEVRSELGAGTSLTIQIPCVLPPQAAE